MLLPAGAATVVPVSCVEQGRWYGGGDSRLAGRHSAPSVRAGKSASVATAMRAGRGRRSDQGRVWDEVQAHSTMMAAPSATGSLLDVDAATRTSVDTITADLTPLPGQRGMIVGIGGEVRALELFDSGEVFAHYFSRLVDGFAAEAVAARQQATSSSSARAFVRSLRRLPVAEAPAVGLGTEISAGGEDLAVLGLRVPDRPTPLHLVAFAA